MATVYLLQLLPAVQPQQQVQTLQLINLSVGVHPQLLAVSINLSVTFKESHYEKNY